MDDPTQPTTGHEDADAPPNSGASHRKRSRAGESRGEPDVPANSDAAGAPGPAEASDGSGAGGALDSGVEVTVVRVEGGGIESATAASVEVHMGGIGLVDAEEVIVSVGGVGAVRTGSLDVQVGAVGAVLTGEASVTQSAAGSVVAREAHVVQSFVRTLIARNVTFERPSAVLVMIAGRVEGDVRPLLDWRGALAAGAALGIVTGLVGALRRGGRRFGRG
jgi:hypothetical protein